MRRNLSIIYSISIHNGDCAPLGSTGYPTTTALMRSSVTMRCSDRATLMTDSEIDLYYSQNKERFIQYN